MRLGIAGSGHPREVRRGGFALAAAFVLATAPAAAAARLQLERPSLTHLAGAAAPIRDSILRGGFRLTADAPAGTTGGVFDTGTGEHVTIYVSSSYREQPEIDQWWATKFFPWLTHGAELSSLTVVFATPSEVQAICGLFAEGCYSPLVHTMVVPGSSELGANVEQVVAHEYGHHIAASRSNPPWDAGEWGPKNWATSESVCAKQAAGTAFPGDEADHYVDNPGEAWAETYRFWQVDRAQKANAANGIPPAAWSASQIPWDVADSWLPSPIQIAAAERDVTSPYTPPAPAVWAKTFKKATTFRLTYPFTTMLDGTVSVAASAGVTVSLLDADTQSVLAPGSSSLSYTDCGTRSFTLVATGKRLKHFSVTIQTP